MFGGPQSTESTSTAAIFIRRRSRSSASSSSSSRRSCRRSFRISFTTAFQDGDAAEVLGRREMRIMRRMMRMMMTCGGNSSHFETSIIDFPTSEGVSEVSERAKE